MEKELFKIAKDAINNDRSPSNRKCHVNTHVIGSGSSLSSVKASSGFLVDVTRCFRNRTMQALSETVELSQNSLIPSNELKEDILRVAASIDEDTNDANTNNLTNEKSTKNDNVESVIELRSYHVPSPRTSSGVFSTLGFFSCFGGCKLQLASIKNTSMTDEGLSMMNNSKLNSSSTSTQHAQLPSSSQSLNRTSRGVEERKKSFDRSDSDAINDLDCSLHNPQIAGVTGRIRTQSQLTDVSSTVTDSQLPLISAENKSNNNIYNDNNEVTPNKQKIYLKTYADFLLHQSALKASEKREQSNRKKSLESMNKQVKRILSFGDALSE